MHNGVHLEKVALTSSPSQKRRYNQQHPFPLIAASSNSCVPSPRISPSSSPNPPTAITEAAAAAADPMAALGSKLAQLQSKACEATRFAAKHGCAYHKTLMEKNKHYVVDPPTIHKCQELSKQLFYTRLASLPGRYESFWKELDGAKQFWKNRSNLKVEDAGVAALFGIELYAWFCVGEIVGRGFTLTGYHV